jgi:pantetheine-phosphate adenylyltransferase
MATKALYAGSFDPLTNGHLDVIKRASALFDHVVVGVGVNQKKPGLFTVEERVELLKKSCRSLKNISFSSFNGLTVDFAAQQKCQVLVRGLRDNQDFTIETNMAHMNSHLKPKIDTVFLPCLQNLSDVSSTLIKEVASLGGDVGGLVPQVVEQALRKKFSK